ncbi:lysozyme inhibitor LprI family protein [Methylocella sp.]|uniref:lysozyme inhibitor LprI family protein n=1 Tax=Methylocella sp. TaxID=1978226 RepID=UPI0037832C24
MPSTIFRKFLTSRACFRLDRRAALCAAFCAAGAPAALGQIASFDCAKAELAAEKRVCDTPALGARDVKMATLYQTLQGAEPAWSGMAYREFRDNQRELQATWASKTRDPCGGDAACLSAAYDRRIDELAATLSKSLGLTFGRMCDGAAAQ